MKLHALMFICVLLAGCASLPSPVVGTWRNTDIKYRLMLLSDGTFREGNPAQSKTGKWKLKSNVLTLFVRNSNVYIGTMTIKPPYKQIMNVLEMTEHKLKLKTSSGRVLTLER